MPDRTLPWNEIDKLVIAAARRGEAAPYQGDVLPGQQIRFQRPDPPD